MKAVLRRGSLSAAAALGLCLALAPAAQAHAQILVPCGNVTALRNAINEANSTGEDITLAPSCTYKLKDYDSPGHGLPSIKADVTINGFNTAIERDSTDSFRIFTVEPGGALTLNRITVRNGNVSDDGGGIWNGGTLTVQSGAITGNSAINGGGLFNAPNATATLSSTTVSDNRATTGDGGGILNAGTLRLNASTVQGNRAADQGGGLGDFSPGRATLASSRVSGNSAIPVSGGRGGGIWENPGSTVTLLNTGVTANTGGNCRPPGSVPGCTG